MDCPTHKKEHRIKYPTYINEITVLYQLWPGRGRQRCEQCFWVKTIYII